MHMLSTRFKYACYGAFAGIYRHIYSDTFYVMGSDKGRASYAPLRSIGRYAVGGYYSLRRLLSD